MRLRRNLRYYPGICPERLRKPIMTYAVSRPRFELVTTRLRNQLTASFVVLTKILKSLFFWVRLY
jgi:hypothetical protein